MYRSIVTFIFPCLCAYTSPAQPVYELKHGVVRFYSLGQGEHLSASSSRLNGHMDLKTGSFNFQISISSFRGFNCALLRFHFNTSCMETMTYPVASFEGNLLDRMDLSGSGECTLRAKGKLNIHGMEQYRVVKVHVVNNGTALSFTASMPIALNDFGIRVPKIWIRKTTTEVVADVSGTLRPQQDARHLP